MKDKLLQEIQSIFPSGKIKYVGATIKKSDRSLIVRFISSFAVSDEDRMSIAQAIKACLPSGISAVSVEVNKIIALPEFVARSTVGFLKDTHRIVFSEMTEGDVTVTPSVGAVKVDLKLESTVFDYFNNKNVGSELREYLEKNYVDNFIVSASDKGGTVVDEASLQVKDDAPAPQIKFRRQLTVDEVTPLFDRDGTRTATYIADTDGMLGEVYIAGVISNIREQMSKNDKQYFILELSDRTGTLSGAIFPNKDKIPKMKKLAVGSEIILRGEFEMRGEYRNLRIRSINLCVFPKNFVPQERPKRPVPAEYCLIKPQPLVLEKQDNFLEYKTIPECFLGRTFVVFDFETTGTDFDDKITEIGAVKVVDGKLIEYFTTLINPHKHIPAEVVNITGIDDTMVAEAPDFREVCPDFYKFCYGATLVAHNIEFDSRFLKNQSAPYDYHFDNLQLDTLALGRECIYGVANYKLNTLCDKFGIVFRHHRALSDAIATAELLIEIIRIRGSLPF